MHEICVCILSKTVELLTRTEPPEVLGILDDPCAEELHVAFLRFYVRMLDGGFIVVRGCETLYSQAAYKKAFNILDRFNFFARLGISSASRIGTAKAIIRACEEANFPEPAGDLRAAGRYALDECSAMSRECDLSAARLRSLEAALPSA